MKAAVTTGAKRKVVYKEVPTPSVQSGQLLLKTKYCSICGTDLEYLDGDLESFEWGKLHSGAILGHEFSAKVVAVGDGIEGWSVGDRVACLWPPAPCGECYFCKRKLYELCVRGPARATEFTGVPEGFGTKNGAMAEYFLRAPFEVQKVPDSVSDEEAALCEPLDTSLGAVKAAGLKLGDTAVIIGAGKIGLGALLWAKASGVNTIVVTRRRQSRLDKALEMGADVVLNASKVDVISEVVKLTEAGPDAVLICARAAEVLNQAVDMVRRGGTIVIVGYMPPLEVDPNMWITKQLKFNAIYGGGDMRLSLRLVANKQVDIKPLISEVIPLAEVQRAFDSMYSGENTVVLLKP